MVLAVGAIVFAAVLAGVRDTPLPPPPLHDDPLERQMEPEPLTAAAKAVATPVPSPVKPAIGRPVAFVSVMETGVEPVSIKIWFVPFWFDVASVLPPSIWMPAEKVLGPEPPNVPAPVDVIGSVHVTVAEVVTPSSQCDCAPMVVAVEPRGITPDACPDMPLLAAPPSFSVTPSVLANSATWFAVDEPGPIAQVAQAIVPLPVIGPPESGAVVSTSVTVPLPPPPPPPPVIAEIETAFDGRIVMVAVPLA